MISTLTVSRFSGTAWYSAAVIEFSGEMRN